MSGKLPRVIVASDNAFQVFCGPSIHHFDHTLQEFLDCTYRVRGIRLWFTVGWTQARLSQEFTTATDVAKAWDGSSRSWLRHVTVFVLGDDNLTVFPNTPGTFMCFANDFSSFDTTHSENSFSIQEKLMRACGVPPDVIAVIKATTKDINLSAMNFGGRFIAHWNMCSGNPNTCNGNSAIGCIVALYILTNYPLAFRNGDAAMIEKVLRDLGFEPKCTFGSVDKVDYLSGVFLLNDRGDRYVWIPKPFRLLTKSMFVSDLNTHMNVHDYRSAIASCYKAYEPWCPIISDLVKLYERLSGAPTAKSTTWLSRDRNLLYAPSTAAVTSDSVTKSFMLRYGLNEYSLTSLQYHIRYYDLMPSDRIPFLIDCLLVDVPDYSP